MGFLHVEITSQDCGGKMLGNAWQMKLLLALHCLSQQANTSSVHGMETRLHFYDSKYFRDRYRPHELVDIWVNRLISNAPTICYWTTVRYYLLIKCRLIQGQRMGDCPLTAIAYAHGYRPRTHYITIPEALDDGT